MKTKKTKIKEFTVNLDKWRCGGFGNNQHGEGETYLLNKKGYMCCLGFGSQQLGRISKKKLLHADTPACLNVVIPGLTEKTGKNTSIFNTSFSEKAVIINDNKTLTLDERIAKLKALGKKHGIKINFRRGKK